MKTLKTLSDKALLHKSNAKNSEKDFPSVYDIEIKGLDGTNIELAELKGKYILFVNVASKCGFTKQYRQLEHLYQKNKDLLMIIGLPCNQFGSQEPGTAQQIQAFCQKNYGVSFLMTEKVSVKGINQHPIYQWLTNKGFNGKFDSSVKWNFQKYLIGPDGKLIDFYYSLTAPLSKKITKHLT